MAGAKLFSKLNVSASYWQMKLDERSFDLLAFNTPFGRYKFKRLPFCVHCVSEIFSKRISELLNGLEGAAHIQDDIIIWRDGKEQHDNRLKLVLDRIKSCGLKLNRVKCVFGVKKIKCVGHINPQSIINKAPARIQRMLLHLQKYDIELQFTPGTNIPTADALSRASLKYTSSSMLDYQVHLLMSNLQVSKN